MISHKHKMDYDTGKVIVALHKKCIGRKKSINFSRIFSDGIHAVKIEPLFHSDNKNDGNDVGAIVQIHLRTKDNNAVMDAINRLMSNPCVVFAEPDYYFDSHVIPNDPYLDYLWGLEEINSPSAWNYTTGSDSVVVGVIDSGIELNHPDINDNLWDIPLRQGLHGRDFFNDTGNSGDLTGHGTHVAGTIGAVGNNLIGVTGVCWNVKMLSLKIGDAFFDTAAAIKAINYANDYRIPILNGSWGARHYSAALKYAIDNYDGLFIASAGNNGTDNDVFPMYPASFSSGNIISVASINPSGSLSYFSNYGSESVDIAAPGTDIFSCSLLGGYSFMSGTSMSAPHVAGAAALLKSYRPNLTAYDIKNILLSSAVKQPYLAGRLVTEGSLNIAKMMNMAAHI